MVQKSIILLVALALVMVLGCEITGRVTDVMPTQTAIGVDKEAIADSESYFVVNAPNPGQYAAHTKVAGFLTQSQRYY